MPALGERAGGRAGEERLGSAPEQNYRASTSFLGWLAEFLGRFHAFVKFRGWSDVAPRVQRQRRMLPGKLVVFQREPRRKRATHAKFSRTHTLAETGNFWFCWRCGFHTARRVQEPAGRCRGIVQRRGGVPTVLVSQKGSECRSCVVAPNAIDFAYCGELPHEPVPCAQMVELCKALEELHVELEELLLEQYRARDELPLMQQWARGRADDRVTLSADLETMDLLTTATPPPTLRPAEPRRLQNDFEDFFGTRRPQLIRSAEVALPLLTSWDLLVVDKPAGARPRSDKSTEQVLAETTRPCPRCFVPMRRAGGCVHMTCGNPRCQHEFCWLWLHDWTRATHDASFCTGRAEASHLEVLASVERQIRSNWAQQPHDTRPAEDTYAEEVLQHFRVALTTRLESDAELFSAEDADVPLRWRRLFEFYDHREMRIRANSQVSFAGVVDSHRAQLELIELLSSVRDRWWIRLSPEDVDAHNESFIDPQAFLELPFPVRRRMHAERALVRLEQHLGSQLAEYERNMAERTRQEVGANRAEITSALEAVAANNAQLVAWRNVAFEQRDRAPRQTVREEFDDYRAHIAVEMQEEIPAHVEARIAEVRDFFRGQFNEGPVEWNNMPASTVKRLQRHCAKRFIAS